MIARSHGGPETLEPATPPTPEPGPGQVRVRVAACGVNFADLLMLKGTYQSTPALPFSPGGEICGVVEAVGEGVATPRPGERVVACCGHGGFAEQALAPAAACVRAPASLDDASAAALPVAYGSAEMALMRRARLREGEALLVSGAGGGAGLTAVALGALAGANVIALARGAEKQAAAREAGAAATLDPSGFDLSGRDLADAVRAAAGGRAVDVIYDPVGGPLLRAMMRACAFEARVLPIGFASGEVPELKANHLLVKNVDVIGFWWGAYFEAAPQAMRQSLERIMGWAEAGAIRPLVSHRVPLERAGEALDLLRTRKALGKAVVVP